MRIVKSNISSAGPLSERNVETWRDIVREKHGDKEREIFVSRASYA